MLQALYCPHLDRPGRHCSHVKLLQQAACASLAVTAFSLISRMASLAWYLSYMRKLIYMSMCSLSHVFALNCCLLLERALSRPLSSAVQ